MQTYIIEVTEEQLKKLRELALADAGVAIARFESADTFKERASAHVICHEAGELNQTLADAYPQPCFERQHAPEPD